MLTLKVVPQVYRVGLQLELVSTQVYAGWRQCQCGKMTEVDIQLAWMVVIFIFSSCLKTAFFRQHGCTTNDTNAKYNSRAAQMYREKIRQLANTALSKYGTDVSISSLLLWPQVNTFVLRIDGMLRKRRLSLLRLWAVKVRPESAGHFDKYIWQHFNHQSNFQQ